MTPGVLLLAATLAAAPENGSNDALKVVRDTGSLLARPFQLEGDEALVMGVVGVGTGILLTNDIALWHAIDRNVRWTWRGQSMFNQTLLLGDGMVDLGIVSLFAIGDAKARRTALEGVETLAAVSLASVIAKHVFRVARPSYDYYTKHYFNRFQDDAFPSGHTMSAFGTATVIASEYPALAPIVYPLAGLVGLSVIKRGWHWPSDVLAGAAMGIVFGRGAVLANHHDLHVQPMPGGLGVTGTY